MTPADFSAASLGIPSLLDYIGPMLVATPYCLRCKCSHDYGKHTIVFGQPLPQKQAPAAKQEDKLSNSREIKTAATERPKPAKRQPLMGKSDGFDRDGYQKEYMADRREADAAGFGGSKATNPNYLTVKQYRERKSNNGSS